MLVSILSDRINKMAEEISYCGPCLREETKLPAVIHCLECSESLCENCRKFHQKMKSLSLHKVYNLCDGKIDTEKFDFLTSLTQCPEHVTEDVKYICKDHDQMCCNECAIVKHRKCDHMVSLANEITELKNTGKETKKRFEEIEHKAEKLIQYEKKHESSVHASVVKVEEKVVKIKNIIDEAFLKMKKAITCVVEEKCGNIVKQSRMQIEGIESLKSDVDQSRKKLNFVSENEEKVHLFLVEKVMEVELRRYDETLQKFRRDSSFRNINMVEDITDQDLARTVASCFHIEDEASQTKVPPYRADNRSELKDMEPVLEYEENLNVFGRSCILIDDYLVVALQDTTEIQLLAVDKKAINYITSKKMSSQPWSVAVISNLKFAIGVKLAVEQ